MNQPINVHEYEALARTRMEPDIWDYYAGGAEDEVSVRGNRAAWERWWLRADFILRPGLWARALRPPLRRSECEVVAICAGRILQ